MVHESMKNLQYDRRLHGRRGWVAEKELEQHLEELPDAAAKGELIADIEDAAGDGGAPAPAGAPAAPAPEFTPTEG